MLDREVYANSAVAELINSKSVSLKVDAEKKEGPELKKKFNIRGFPTAIIVDSKTKKELDRIVGYSPPALYLLMLEEIYSGKHFAAVRKKALDSPDDVDAWFDYAKKLDQRDPEEARKAWENVAKLDPRDEKGKGSVALGTLARMDAFQQRDPKPLLKIVEKFSGKPAALEAHGGIVRLLGTSKKEKDQEQVIASYQYMVSHGKKDAETLNSYAWYLANLDRSLKRAVRMARQAAKLEPEKAHIADTVAECYSRLGQHKKAVDWARKALELSSDRQKAFFEKRLKEFEEPKKQRRSF